MVDVDATARTVTVGPPAMLDVDLIEGIRPIWAGPAISGEAVAVHAQVRAHGVPVPATAHVAGDRLIVLLDEPIRGLATGQAVVLYDGTRVVGSATIDRTRRVVNA